MQKKKERRKKKTKRGLTVITSDGPKTAMTTTTISETPVKPSEKTQLSSDGERNYRETDKSEVRNQRVKEKPLL